MDGLFLNRLNLKQLAGHFASTFLSLMCCFASFHVAPPGHQQTVATLLGALCYLHSVFLKAFYATPYYVRVRRPLQGENDAREAKAEEQQGNREMGGSKGREKGKKGN